MGTSNSSELTDKNSAVNYFIFAHKKKVLYAPIALLILFLIVINSTNKYSLFPLHKHLTVNKQSDAISDNGNTEMSEIAGLDSTLNFSFILRKGYKYPYAGIGINTIDSSKSDSSGIDLSRYDNLHVTLSSTSRNKQVKFYFSTFVKGFTQMAKPMSWRVFEYNIPVDENMQKVKIDLKEFETPVWWFDLNKVTAKDLGEGDLKNCLSMVIENNDYEAQNERVEVFIKEIYLTKNLGAVNTTILVLLLLYSGIYYYLINFGLKQVMGTPVVIPYHQLDVASYADEDAVRIEEFVANNYSNQELLVKDVSRKTGVTQAKIQVILKNKFQMSFRQYLNTIRTYEAKRLLRETDRQVTDIAYRVGYKNVTHFNRIFKDSEGLSPNQYRKKNYGK